MNLRPEPDVAFGVHPDLGVAAAVAVDRPSLDEALRRYHFRYSQDLDIYLLPDDTPHNTAVRTVASATREFQDVGLSVAADPRIMLLPPIPTADDIPAREPVPGQSLTALTSQLHWLRHSADVAEVLEQILDQHQGAVGDLEEFIDTAAAWCERLDTPNGRELSLRLRTIAHHVAFLGDQRVDAQLDLAVMPDVTPGEAPPLADMPLPERHEFLPVTHTARARAAVSSSPHSPADVSPAARASAEPQAAASPSRRMR
ncbi:hypothetical protein [Streptomyces tubercidicus]|uniref:hypothetical protein n=1 Tax=Streptomyces tubercidicus TaxID=47759 RepID=UPI002E135EDE|nr:hypothetical protein OG761_29645 [Streptomyces tubercidicus]WSX19714.1 hypothetical protein OG690_07740 [Streptomyces tubercidicus]